MKRQPTLQEMIQREQREAQVVSRYIAGEDISSEPLYFRGCNGESILTYAGALNVASILGIERVSEQIKGSVQRNGKPAHFAVVKVRLGSSTRAGAATSQDVMVACELAFRNAVKQTITN